MPWLRIDDRLPMSAKIKGLADREATGDRAKRQRNEAIGHWLMILAWCASERSDGFVMAQQVDEYGTRESAARLLRARFGRAPLIHGRNDVCPCLEGRRWPPDYDYAVHDWLDKNPSRSENDVAKAQRKELRDRELREQVRRRDGDCCRYCGKAVKWQDRKSPAGGVLDHVRPDLAAGADNLVVACRACNTRKGKRTPEAAGMALLPAAGHPRHPTRPGANGHQINDGSKTVSDPTTDRPPDRPENRSESASDPVAGRPPPRASPSPAPSSADVPAALLVAFPEATYDGVTDGIRSTGTDGLGRVGSGTGYVVGPPDTPRSPSSPNPYLRSAITGPQPEDHAGLPPPPEEERPPWT